MNSQFNYASFVDMFLESDEEHEPYGVTTFLAQPVGQMDTERDDPSLSPPS